MAEADLDLLMWPEVQAARAAHAAVLDAAARRIEIATEAYRSAVRRYRLSPHGEAGRRKVALRQANVDLLRAELDYAALERAGSDLS